MTHRGSRETRNQGLSGKHVSKIRILKIPAKFRSLINYYQGNLFALIRTEHKVELNHNSAVQEL